MYTHLCEEDVYLHTHYHEDTNASTKCCWQQLACLDKETPQYSDGVMQTNFHLSYSVLWKHNFCLWQSLDHNTVNKSYWHIFVIPPLLSSSSSPFICCLPFSVLSYQSHYKSLHLPSSSSSSLYPHLFQLFLIKSYLDPLALWANIGSQTVAQAHWKRCNMQQAFQHTLLIRFTDT